MFDIVGFIGLVLEIVVLIMINNKISYLIKVEQLKDDLKNKIHKCDEIFDKMQIDIYEIEQRLKMLSEVVYSEKK